MLIPLACRVISRILSLKRSRAFGAIARLISGPSVKLNPEELSLLRSRYRALGLLYLELETLSDEAGNAIHHPMTSTFAAHIDVAVSSPRESHPEALAELYVSLSTHTGPIMEPRRVPICQ